MATNRAANENDPDQLCPSSTDQPGPSSTDQPGPSSTDQPGPSSAVLGSVESNRSASVAMSSTVSTSRNTDDDADQETRTETERDAPTEGLNITVKHANGQEISFWVKPYTRLRKLKKVYAKKVGMDVDTLRFLYDGAKVRDEDTADSLDLEDGDTIDVMTEQIGG